MYSTFLDDCQQDHSEGCERMFLHSHPSRHVSFSQPWPPGGGYERVKQRDASQPRDIRLAVGITSHRKYIGEGRTTRIARTCTGSVPAMQTLWQVRYPAEEDDIRVP